MKLIVILILVLFLVGCQSASVEVDSGKFEQLVKWSMYSHGFCELGCADKVEAIYPIIKVFNSDGLNDAGMALMATNVALDLSKEMPEAIGMVTFNFVDSEHRTLKNIYK